MRNLIFALKTLAVLTLFISASGFSHALLVSPVPREYSNDANAADVINTSGNETGPCAPGLPAVPCATTADPSSCTFTVGQAIPVTFEAVIQHDGPFTLLLGPAAATSTTPQSSFAVLLSPATAPTTPFTQTEMQNSDGTFTEVQKNTVSTSTPDVYKEYVVIPLSTTPGNYTLQLQQADAPVTYYTCADIIITAAGAGPVPTPSVSVSISPSPTPSNTGGGGPISSQGLGNNPTSDNGGAKMASCGAVHDVGNGPGRGPGAAAMIVLPLLMLMLLRGRVLARSRVRVRNSRR